MIERQNAGPSLQSFTTFSLSEIEVFITTFVILARFGRWKLGVWLATATITMLCLPKARQSKELFSKDTVRAPVTSLSQETSFRERKRICLISPDIADVTTNNGGIGTAFVNLALHLADRGHKVTLVAGSLGGEVHPGSSRNWTEWVAYFAAQNVTLASTYKGHMNSICKEGGYFVGLAYEAFMWLMQHDGQFDVIHFPQWTGMAYFTSLAKRQGLFTRDITVVVQAHSSSVWIEQGNLRWPDRYILELDFMERKSIELADVVISPSYYMLQWMEEHRWALPSEIIVLPNLPAVTSMKASSQFKAQADTESIMLQIHELVFFGRLERRKGVYPFIEAIEALITSKPTVLGEIRQITFLGKHVSDQEADVKVAIDKLIALAVIKVPQMKIEVLETMSSEAARHYLSRSQYGRLAVIPSLIDNLPYAVQECIDDGIPFIASDVGGCRELVHVEDQSYVLFTLNELEIKLIEVIQKGYLMPVRPQLNFEEKIQMWDLWHRKHVIVPDQRVPSDSWGPTQPPLVSVILLVINGKAHLEKALRSIDDQDYPDNRIEVVLVDDGVLHPTSSSLQSLLKALGERNWKRLAVPSGTLGMKRSKGAAVASGEYIVFMDDTSFAVPDQISTLVRTMRRGHADVLVGLVKQDEDITVIPSQIEIPSLFFNPATSWHRNSIDIPLVMLRVSTLRILGGVVESSLAFEDWDILSILTMHGINVELVALPLASRQVRPTLISDGKQEAKFSSKRRWELLRPLVQIHGWDSFFGGVLVALQQEASYWQNQLSSFKDYRPYQGYKNLYYEYRIKGGKWNLFDGVSEHGGLISLGLGELPTLTRNLLHPSSKVDTLYEVGWSWHAYLNGYMGIIVEGDGSIASDSSGVDMYVEWNGERIRDSERTVTHEANSYYFSWVLNVQVGQVVRVAACARSAHSRDFVQYKVVVTFQDIGFSNSV